MHTQVTRRCHPGSHPRARQREKGGWPFAESQANAIFADALGRGEGRLFFEALPTHRSSSPRMWEGESRGAEIRDEKPGGPRAHGKGDSHLDAQDLHIYPQKKKGGGGRFLQTPLSCSSGPRHSAHSQPSKQGHLKASQPAFESQREKKMISAIPKVHIYIAARESTDM